MESPVDYLYANRHKHHTHPFVDELFINKKDIVKYRLICTYIYFNKHTGEFYIGSGNKSARSTTHIRDLNNRTHYNKLFQQAYVKDNRFEFHFVICNTRKEALALEQTLLDMYWFNPGRLNLARFVELPTLGLKYSDARKEVIIKNNKKMWSTPGHYDKVFTPEANAKRGLINKEAYENGRVPWMLGKKHSEETKNKIRIINTERFNSNPDLKIKLRLGYSAYRQALTQNDLENISIEAKNRTTTLWKDNVYRDKVISGINYFYKSNPNALIVRSNKMTEYSNRPDVKKRRSDTHKKLWSNSEFKREVSNAIAASWTEERRKKQSIISAEFSNRPDVKKRRSITSKEFATRPENILKLSNRNKNNWSNAEYRENHEARLSKYNNAASKKIYIEGVLYDSINAARRALNVSWDFINSRLNNPNNLDYVYLT